MIIFHRKFRKMKSKIKVFLLIVQQVYDKRIIMLIHNKLY
uniref:Uncharacterized protein n=1 Tax=Anguilla anguilla TaxID=7936 RepID=A0A0E9S3C9_ANGAN